MEQRDVPVLVVMGVSGSGKTTIGQRVANRLGAEFVEGDELHPAANVEKMRSGEALTDDDRWPWLHKVAARLGELAGTEHGGVVTCSALKRSYRDVLREGWPRLFLVHLAADKSKIAERVASRDHEYMPASLLDSQYADLEPLEQDERGVTVDAARDRASNVADVLAALGMPR